MAIIIFKRPECRIDGRSNATFALLISPLALLATLSVLPTTRRARWAKRQWAPNLHDWRE